jgi:kexin
MSKLLSNQKWFFIAIGAVLIFGISAGVYFWRRRTARQRRAKYSTLAGDDVAMGSISRNRQPNAGGGRAKELYDAFGEVSDEDEEDADEETGLRPRGLHDESPGGRLAFHSGFLDDDEPSSAPHTSIYKDEPDEARLRDEVDHSRSPTNGSGDSWEHASQTR